MARVRLLADSYERYQKPGDRKSLVTLHRGDTFDVDDPELKRLIELRAVATVQKTKKRRDQEPPTEPTNAPEVGNA